MKTSKFAIALLICTIVGTQAQVIGTSTQGGIGQSVPPAPTPYSIMQRDGNSQVWERTVYESGPLGQAVPIKHRYTELATGLNFKDPQTGQWTPSKEEIVILPNGTAAATKGQHQAYFPGDIAQGLIEQVTPDGKQFQSRPIALSYDDGSGTVLIAVLTNSVGYLVGSNQVIYFNAFSGLSADLIYTYTKTGFEQDIVLQEQPPAPEDFGLNAGTTRLQVITEFFNPPPPVVSTRILPTQTGITQTDQQLNFGIMQMIPGKAFLLGTNSLQVQVAKQWLTVDGRQLLVEEVPVASVASELLQLPPPQANLTKRTPNSPLHVISAKRLLPAQNLAKTGNKMPVMSKASPPDQGLVIDYQTINSSLTNYTFRGDTTYYISGAIYLNGTNTVEGGAVLKYGHNASLNLMYSFSGPTVLNWLSTAYNPVIFTSRYDNSVGEIISGSTGRPPRDASPALSYPFSVPNVVTLGHFRMANFQTGITFQADNQKLVISDAQFVNGNCAINAYDLSSPLIIENTLFTNMNTAIQLSQAPVVGENLTFVGIASLATPSDPMGTWLYLTNCILANVTNLYSSPLNLFTGSHNGFYESPEFGDNQITNTFYPFQTAGGGKFYLAEGCVFTNAGTTNIDPALMADLATKTTYPPIVYSNTIISNSLSLIPQAQRDTNAAPALGYHYDPIDYIVDNCTVSNTVLTIAAGTALATYNEPGLKLADGGSIVSSGTATAPNWFTRYQAVQEQSVSLGGTNVISGVDVLPAYNSAAPSGSYQFTKFISPAGGGTHLYDLAGSSYSNLVVQDCEFWSGNNVLGGTNGTVLRLNNNLFARSVITATGNGTLAFTNNLVWGASSLQLNQGGGSVWSAFNNDFDSTVITNSTLTNGYNAYLNNTGRLSPTNANDIVAGVTMAYQTGPLGTFYQPANSQLIDKGSTNANLIGLYHFTTQTNQMKETNSTVDIGYHYVTTDSNGNPLDTDGDGTSDYLEDTNGNGMDDPGETPWDLAILSQPQSLTVPAGSNATFSVLAGGISLSYQWRFNGANIAGATNSSYSLTPAQPANAGNYSVVISNPDTNMISSNAVLTIVIPPLITTQPTNLTVNLSSNATFVVSIDTTSTTPLGYQWLWNGNVLAGATNSSLTVTNIQITNAGYYSVIITNAAGANRSAEASLTVTIFSAGWTNTSAMKLNGDAVYTNTSDGRVLELTRAIPDQAGSAFFSIPITLISNLSFSTFFSFRLSADGTTGGNANGAADNHTGADGIVFVVQSRTNNIVGTNGSGMGYFGITNSLGVEFDTYCNSLFDQRWTCDPNEDGNHIGIDYDGLLTNAPSGLQTNGYSAITIHVTNDMNNSNIWYAWVDYNGATSNLEVRLSESNPNRSAAQYLLTNTVNLSNYLNATNAYLGFTAGTGGSYDQQNILSWQFISPYHPIGTIGTNASVPPVVTIIYPTNGQTLLAGSTVTISATATNTTPGVTISWVEFFSNGTNNSIGFALTPTNGLYQIKWTFPVGGTNVLMALAMDSQDLTAWSVPATNYTRRLPWVTLTSPTNGQVFSLSFPMTATNIPISAVAVADRSTITNVTFYRGTTNLGKGMLMSSNASFTWIGATNGMYTLTARATDSNGVTGITFPVNITIEPTNRPPLVYAGPDQTNNLSTNAIQLVGQASDDGLPYGTLSVYWANISGPTNVNFMVTNLAATSVYFYATGAYQFVLSASDGQYTTYSTDTVTILRPNLPPNVYAGTDQVLILPALANTNPIPTLKLTPLANGLNPSGEGLGLDYFVASNCLVVSDGSAASTFALVLTNNDVFPFSSIGGIGQYQEIKIATVRDGLGGFGIGEMFSGTDANGEMLRIRPDGTTVGTNVDNIYTDSQGNLQTNYVWVILAPQAGPSNYGLWVDRTGVWGGDLIAVVYTNGPDEASVWRINSAGKASFVAELQNGTFNYIEESVPVTTVPDDVQKYGPWAGRILVGAPEGQSVFAVDTNGTVSTININTLEDSILENIIVIPEDENLYGINTSGTLYGAPASEFQGMVGDILITDEEGGLYRVYWDGANLNIYKIGQSPVLGPDEQTTFAPAGIGGMPAVNYVQLQGVVSDDGFLFSPTSNTWFQVGGPSPVTFDNPALTNTIARFTQPGTYYLQLSADDGQFTSYSSNQVKIAVLRNQAPAVDAGTNQIVSVSTTTLSGTVSDDGLPFGVTNVCWMLVQGPSTNVAFGNSNQLVTTVTFSVPGTYVFRLTADDGQATSSAEVTITTASANLTLKPNYGWPTRTNTSYTVTATLLDQNGSPMVGSNIVFSVSGTDSGIILTNQTDSHGNAWFTYSGTNLGQDAIQASNVESGVVSPTVIKDWAADIGCGSDTGTHLSPSWSLDWPTNEIHYSDYYLFPATAGSSFTLDYQVEATGISADYYHMVLVLRDPSNNIVDININGFLTYTPLVSGDYLIEMTDIVLGEQFADQLTLSCGSYIGINTAPQLQVLLDGTNVPNGGTIVFPATVPLSPTNLSLVIANTGTAPLLINLVTNSGDFALTNDISGSSINPGSSTNLGICFNASSNETCVGELLLQHEAVDQVGNIYSDNYMIQLVGNAFPTGAPPSIQITYPNSGCSFFAPASIPISLVITNGTATNGNTSVAYVDIRATTTNGTINISQHTAPPYSTTWQNTPEGEYTLNATVVDNLGRSGASMPVTIHVLPPNGNQAPVASNDWVTVLANSANNILHPLTNDYDPNTNSLTIIAVAPPERGTANIINNGQAISYTPPPNEYGYPADSFHYEISDGMGGTAWATVYVNVNGSGMPAVSLAATCSITNAGAVDPLVATVTPSQYVAHVDFYLGQVLLGTVTNGINGLFTNYWKAVYDPCRCGFTAQVTDIFGQTNTSWPPISINVTNGNLSGSLTAALDSVTDTNGTIALIATNPTVIRDGLFTLYGRANHSLGSNVVWQLGVYSQDGSTLLRNLAPLITTNVGTTTVSNLLTTCNLTTLQNGVYDLKLTVIGGFQMTSTDVPIILDSNLKIGQFSFSQQDLVIPVNGIPLTVTRNYNSINPNRDDFGYGWTYSLSDMDVALDESRQDTDDLLGEEGGEFGDSPTGTFSERVSGNRDVTLTLPNGQRTTFYFYLQQSGTYTYQATWVSASGVTATLTAQGDSTYSTFTGQGAGWQDGTVPFDNYDFPGFILRMQDGTQYIIKRDPMGEHGIANGDSLAVVDTYGPPYLAQIVQRSGDTITINPNSVVYTATNGATRQITIYRNDDGLISSITDPNGASFGGPPAVKYDYDSQDNLMDVQRLVDRSGVGTYVTNSFSYTNANFPHYITGIFNGDGTQVAKNFYDDSGKLIAVQDANGNLTQFIHNTTNNMEVVIDRLGHTNTFVYDLRGNVTAQTNALNQVTTMAYDVNNNKTNEIIFVGNLPYATNSYVYDSTNQLLVSYDPLGHTNSFTYDQNGDLTTSMDARGNGSTNTYDAIGNLINTRDALGNNTTNFFNGSLMLGSRDPIGTVTTNYYDGNDNLIRTATLNASGAILSSNTFAYDANNNRTNFTVWRRVSGSWIGATTTYIYDAMNRVVQTIDPDGGTNTVVYDLNGRQQATIDKLGRTNSYSYDTQGRLIQTAYPDGTTESSAYDANGNRATSTDRLGRITSYAYDALNRLVVTTYADNTTNATVYDGVGRVAQTVDARGTITAFAYDVAGRRLAVTNAVGSSCCSTNTYTYDANGNQTNFTDALNHSTTNFYDVLNRQTNVTFADGTKQITVYDAAGRRIAAVDQAGITNWFSYDGAGRLTSVTNALNQITRYKYDEAGNEIAQIDALNRTNTYVYDGMGRRIQHLTPGGQSEGFAYDLAGNLIYQTNFNGVVITNQYDVMNRLTNVVSVNGYKAGYTYTVTSQRATMKDISGLTSYNYDNRDRLLLKTVGWNNGPTVSLNYAYDANGNVMNIWSSTANGVNLVYSYDPLSRLTNVLANGSAAATYGYDLAGNLQAMRYGNGVTNLYQYDSLNRLTNLTWKLTTSTLASFYYQLGITGNRTNLIESVNNTGRTNGWSYDPLYRLTNEVIKTSSTGTLGYGYDAVGNRINRTVSGSLSLTNQAFTFNTNDWLTTDQYDNNGNTTNSSGIFYQYDALNHVTNVNNGTVLIAYDGDGNRASKTIGGTTTYYVLDDRNPSGYVQVLEEWTATGTSSLSKVYNYGLSLIRQCQPNVSTNYFLSDGHGSTRMLTDIGGGSVNAFAYDAYGNLIASSTTPQTVYLYCCQQWDPDLGFYHLRAREDNPNTGRFLTADSYAGNNEDPLSLHKYLYCQNNPVNKIDPSGHMTEDELKEYVRNGGKAAIEAVKDALQTIAEGGENAEALSSGLASFGVALIPDIFLNRVLNKAAIFAKKAEIEDLYPKARYGALDPRGPLPKQADKENFLQYSFGEDKQYDKKGFAPLELSLSTSVGYSFVPFYIRWNDSGLQTATVTLYPWVWDKTLKKFTPALSDPFPIENYPSSVWFHSTGFSYTIQVDSPF